MHHPFGDLLGLKVVTQGDDASRCTLAITPQLHNPNGVLHGGVVAALADTGMALALQPSLKVGEICATIDIGLTYFKPVTSGVLTCTTKVVNRGKRVAHLESWVFCGEQRVARAIGNFSILVPSAAVAAGHHTPT